MNKQFYADYHDEEALLDRLTDGLKANHKEVVFVVGSPLTAPTEKGGPGVSTVGQIVEDIREQFEKKERRDKFDAAIRGAENTYQEAFKFLRARRGASDCNRMIQNAVLRARDVGVITSAPVEAGVHLTAEDCRDFEGDDSNWHLSPGVEALGRLIASQPQIFGGSVVTSNFDPLIEIAIRRAGWKSWRTALHADGDLKTSEAEGCHVVHIHGYWYGTDTLHTHSQLLQARPVLSRSLIKHIRDKLVVVIAYGGWNDVFTTALRELVSDSGEFPDILWAFFDENPELSEDLQGILQGGIDRGRANLYSGIDCNKFLPKLAEEWCGPKSDAGDTLYGVIKGPIVPAISSKPMEALDCDRPPVVESWVGREAELELLERSSAGTVIISGIGGQGKSAFASRYLNQSVGKGKKFSFWDWRDCREYGDSLRTQVISAVQRVADEDVSIELLSEASDADLVEVFINVARRSPGVFVFDNVDHYVDLEAFKFVGVLDEIVRSFSRGTVGSRLIVTCRPNVSYDESNIVTVPLSGLSLEEATELFRLRIGSGSISAEEITSAHAVTDGHPFWLDLMAAQVAHVPGTSLANVLENIRRGRDESPDILSSIWQQLGAREKYLLQVMAEAVRPETRDMLEKYVSSELRYAKFDKALKSLLKLNLVSVKPEKDSPDLYDLHPLVRQFVRNVTPLEERSDVMKRVINQYKIFIDRLTKSLGVNLPLAMLGRWAQKAEIEISAGLTQDAIDTLAEARDALIGGGYAEEYIRVARIILEKVDWVEASANYKGFDLLVSRFIECLDNLGEHEDADEAMARYETTIPNKTARYIKFCDIKCHSFWQRKDFDNAIWWGEEGATLKASTNVDTKYETDYNLALARRDAGQIDKALEFFLGNKRLADFTDPKDKTLGDDGPRIGNVGRCLQLMGETADALKCYRRSIKILIDSSDALRLSNIAYARQWIAECLFAEGECEAALAFAVGAEDVLKRAAPSRIREIEGLKEKIGFELSDGHHISLAKAERVISKWLKS